MERDSTSGVSGHGEDVTTPRRATRAKFSKVRTGCVTCKRRHVKCDEAKPCYRNCIKWAGYCSGYESVDSQGQGQGQARRARAAPVPQAATSGGSVLDARFWEQTMPQLVRESAAVRCANRAVLKMLLAKGASQPSGDALACYGDALHEARQADVAEAVLCSMLFVVFETLHGDGAAAEAHLQSGQRILDTLSTEPESLRTHLGHVLRFLARQERRDERHAFEVGPGCPVPSPY